MKLVVGRILSAIISSGGWLLLGVRTVLDMIGYSTAPDDAAVAISRLDEFLGWLMRVPWWAVFAFALLSTMWLIWVSWPRPNTATDPLQSPQEEVSPPVNEGPLIAINGKFFANERVVLDGKSHTGCTFEACTLVYNGSENVGFNHNKLVPPIAISSDDPKIEMAMLLLHDLGLLKIPFRDETGAFRAASGLAEVKSGDQPSQQPQGKPG